MPGDRCCTEVRGQQERVSHREDRLWRPEVGEAAGLGILAKAGLEYHMPAVLDCEEPQRVSEKGEQGAITVS